MNQCGNQRLLVMVLFWVSMIGGGLLLAGCEPSRQTRGYIFPQQDINQMVHKGMDRSTVLKVLGTPVLVDPLDPCRWVYTQTLTQQKAFHNPEVLERKTLVLSFNTAGILETIDQVDPQAPLCVTPDPTKTPVLGRSFTEIQQMFRGVHHFHKPRTSSSSSPD